jgi:hypothetical protein
MSIRSRSRRSLLFLSLALPALTSGCDEGSCFFFALFSVEVTLIDAQTQAAIVGEGARVTIHDGSFFEELTPLGDGRFRGAEGRTGVYTVEATSPGHEPLVQTDIIIKGGDCDAKPAIVTAALARRQ